MGSESGKEILTLIPGEVPSLQLRLVQAEELGSRNSLTTVLGDGEGKVGVGFSDTCLRAVDGRVNLQTDVEELTSKEIRPGVKQYMSVELHRDYAYQ